MEPRPFYPRPFSLDRYLLGFDVQLSDGSHQFDYGEIRKEYTRTNPILFGLLYLGKHLRADETGNVVSLSEAHLHWGELARRYVQPIGELPAGALRDAIIAPRGLGKSTWWFLIIPMWLAAHGHRTFIAAFANAGTQAQRHLSAFKTELQTNELLRADYPDLCSAAKRTTGASVADTQNTYVAKSGFAFTALGIDSEVLGLKIGNKRPDHLVLDDVEGTAGNYSPVMKEARLLTITDGILPMNNRASLTLAGTVAMPDAIVDNIAAKERGEDYPEWVDDKKFVPRYYDIIQTDAEGRERSVWPERYPMEWINEERHTRDFQSQYRNDPVAADSAFWRGEDFVYRDDIPLTGQLLSIDPAVTAREKSDFTGLAVVGHNRELDICVVRDAWQLRIPPGEPLRRRVLEILDEYPDIVGILVEVNQGGDLWRNTVLHDVPCPVHTVSQSRPKEVRAGSLLAKYQRGRVVHAKRLPALEAQMIRFPLGANDDLIDAVGSGVEVFLKSDKKPRTPSPRTASYV